MPGVVVVVVGGGTQLGGDQPWGGGVLHDDTYVRDSIRPSRLTVALGLKIKDEKGKQNHSHRHKSRINAFPDQ